MATKKYMQVSLSLGTPGSPARLIYKQFIKIHGKRKFAPFIRHLMIMFMSKNPEYAHCRQAAKEFHLLNLKKKIAKDLQEKYALEEELKEEQPIER